jgi:hypothetical protein
MKLDYLSLIHPYIGINILLDKPLYDYQQIIFDSLVTHNGNKHLWIKKATGLGTSEFMLRFMAWLCLKITHYQVPRCVL